MTDTTERAELVAIAEAIEAIRPIPAPVAANASAEARWRSISEDTSWLDGRDVVLLANDMEVQARYCPGEWSDETPNTPREYSGAVWSCFDDQFQLEIEECSKDPSEWGHDGATHWRPVYAHPRASDCDKQGCMGDISSGDPADLQELLTKPSVLEPSDRTADVT